MKMKFLKYYRTGMGLSQQAVADKLGITRQAYGNYENGNRKPDNETMLKLSNIFGVSVDALLLGPEAPKRPGRELINDSPELTEYLDGLSTRPEMRMLFHVTKGATKEQIEAIVRMVESMTKGQG